MDLKNKITADLKTAMLARDAFTTNILRGLKAAILDEEVKSGKREEGLDNAEIEKILVREVKKRKEAASLLDEARAENELKEAEVLQNYLPEMILEADLVKLVDEKVAEIGKDVKNMWRIIGEIKGKLGARVDGTALSQIVKAKLR